MSSWVTSPVSESFEDASGWEKQPSNVYLAARNRLLVSVDDETVLDGPVVYQKEWPVGTTYVVKEEFSRSTMTVDDVQRFVGSTLTSKILRELVDSLSANVTANTLGAALKAAGSFSEKSASELTSSLSLTLTSKHTRSVQEGNRVEHSMQFTVPNLPDATRNTRKIVAYFKYRKIVLTVFLVRIESLLLKYKRPWVWPRIRETIRHETLDPRTPLFQITFYERSDGLSYSFDRHVSQLRNPNAVLVKSWSGTCPTQLPPHEMSLKELAEIAFPINSGEDAARLKRKTNVVWKAAAKKAARPVAKKAAKRASAKKVAAKKVAKGPASNKGAMKRAPAKKVAAKKIAVRAPAMKRAATKKAVAPGVTGRLVPTRAPAKKKPAMNAVARKATTTL